MTIHPRIVYTIKITKCSSDFYWYKDKIGKEYKCHRVTNLSIFWPTDEIYKTVALISDGLFSTRANILPEDCEIISEEKEGFNYNLNNN